MLMDSCKGGHIMFLTSLTQNGRGNLVTPVQFALLSQFVLTNLVVFCLFFLQIIILTDIKP